MAATWTTAGETGGVSRAQDVTLRAVTVIIGIVVGLTFLFGFVTFSILGCGSACPSG